MIRKLLFCFILCCAYQIQAQDLDVSLFDDNPNLGRSAQPLDSLRLTPPPAPDIRIDLDNSQPLPPPEPVAQAPEIPSIPSSPIDLSETNARDANGNSKKGPHVFKDISAFDVSGFELGETAIKAITKAKQRGFRVTVTKEQVPRFYATDYAHKCRKAGFITPQSIAQCIKDYACHEETRYISQATLTKKNEIITLYFTSNATRNALYKIVYLNKGDDSLNFTRINTIKKFTRQKEFWNAVFDKYGYPDDDQNYTWGNPQKAYLKAYVKGAAYDTYLILEDVSLFNEDYFEADDVEKERPPKNTFTF